MNKRMSNTMHQKFKNLFACNRRGLFSRAAIDEIQKREGDMV
jgi:hypothetical protein